MILITMLVRCINTLVGSIGGTTVKEQTSYDIITNRGTVYFAKDIDVAENYYTSLVQDMKLGYNEYVKIIDRKTWKVVKEAYSDRYMDMKLKGGK